MKALMMTMMIALMMTIMMILLMLTRPCVNRVVPPPTHLSRHSYNKEDHNMFKIITIIKSINIIITQHTCPDTPTIEDRNIEHVQNYHDSGILDHKDYHHYHHPTHLSRHSYNLKIITLFQIITIAEMQSS